VGTVGAVDARRRGQVRRRPVVLFAALLAPAIFAGGLMAGEAGRFEGAGEAGWFEGAAPPPLEAKGEGWVGFERVLVPAPARPVRQYLAVVPAPVVEAPVVRVVVAPREVEPSVPVREAAPTPTVEPSPDASPSQCPQEWVETWLWEMCREQERRPGGGEGGGLLGGL
jgi:hypothetical protein